MEGQMRINSPIMDIKTSWRHADIWSHPGHYRGSSLHLTLVTTRGLSAYTARSSFKLFSIATNACMWMLAKQGERQIKKVIKGIHLMLFA